MLYENKFVGGPFDGETIRGQKHQVRCTLRQHVDNGVEFFAVYNFEESSTNDGITTRLYRHFRTMPRSEAMEYQRQHIETLE